MAWGWCVIKDGCDLLTQLGKVEIGIIDIIILGGCRGGNGGGNGLLYCEGGWGRVLGCAGGDRVVGGEVGAVVLRQRRAKRTRNGVMVARRLSSMAGAMVESNTKYERLSGCSEGSSLTS
jgi:hypothetical protein